tara:strand:+ start:564 stop:1139 length:576 start_codon:yes stop_codon:yes gene_type:complete
MSKKHVEEQKLLIENFNKWINEEKCGEKELDEEDEKIDEILGLGAVTGLGYAAGKLITLVHTLASLQNEITTVRDQIAKDPNAPKQLKDTAANLDAAATEATESAGDLAKEIPTSQKLTHKVIRALAKKYLGIDINLSDLPLPGSSKPEEKPEEEPEQQPEPEDTESRQKLGLMSKEKEDRLAYLRGKYSE